MGKESGKCGRDLGKTSLIYKDGTRNWNIADPYPMDIISDSKAKKTYPTAMQCYSQEISIG